MSKNDAVVSAACYHGNHKECPCDAEDLKRGNCECECHEQNREGEQPMPVLSESPFMQNLVQEDIEKRKEIGIRRYGTLLQAHNGRDFLRDAYEEALDLVMYLRGCLYERDGR